MQKRDSFLDKIPSLRPAFDKEGTITAANASTINDGASALILASKEAVEKYGLKPIAKIDIKVRVSCKLAADFRTVVYES